MICPFENKPINEASADHHFLVCPKARTKCTKCSHFICNESKSEHTCKTTDYLVLSNPLLLWPGDDKVGKVIFETLTKAFSSPVDLGDYKEI